MVLPREGHLLRIPVGATVLRGLEGFGAHSRLHTAQLDIRFCRSGPEAM